MGEVRPLTVLTEQGILSTGGKGPSDISEGNGTLTVLTKGEAQAPLSSDT